MIQNTGSDFLSLSLSLDSQRPHGYLAVKAYEVWSIQWCSMGFSLSFAHFLLRKIFIYTYKMEILPVFILFPT